MTELIIINPYGTILPDNNEKITVRNGFHNFLERYKDKKIVLSTYESKEKVESDLKEVGLDKSFDKIYSKKNMAAVAATIDDLEKMYKGEDAYHILQPALKAWSRADFGTPLEEALVISNHHWDVEAARFENGKLIEIPEFTGENDNFSFDSIKIDSLWYNFNFFLQKMNGKPRKIVLK